jgi:hypothetical protein
MKGQKKGRGSNGREPFGRRDGLLGTRSGHPALMNDSRERRLADVRDGPQSQILAASPLRSFDDVIGASGMRKGDSQRAPGPWVLDPKRIGGEGGTRRNPGQAQ